KSLPARGESSERGNELRRLAMHSYLLERIGQTDEGELAPGRPEEGKIDRQPPRVAHGDADARVAGHGRGRGARGGEVIAVDQVGRPCGVAGRGHDRV